MQINTAAGRWRSQFEMTAVGAVGAVGPPGVQVETGHLRAEDWEPSGEDGGFGVQK